MNTELVQPESSDSHARETHTVGLLHMALWFGLVTGFLELVNLGVKKYGFGTPLRMGLNTIWMAPLSGVTVMLLVAVPLAAAGLFLPSRFVKAVGVLAFSGLLASCLTLAHGAIHTFAALALALGVAVNAVRGYLKSANRFEQFVKRSLRWLIVATVVNAVGVFSFSKMSYQETTVEAQSTAPNVLLIVWDTVRTESLSTFGYSRDTSGGLTKLASEGVAFETAFSSAPWTLPSHATLMTGRWADELESNWTTPMEGSIPTLAEILKERGYATAGCIANQLYCGREFGIARGFTHWDDFNQLGVEFVLSSQVGRQLTQSARVRKLVGAKDYWGRKTADHINDEFITWFRNRPDRPFFAFLNYFDAHVPRLPPEPYSTRYADGKLHEQIDFTTYHLRQGEWDGKLTPKQHEADQAAYDGAIAYMDDALIALVNELEKDGVLDNTILIITSDHGEQFGEHDLHDHGNSLYPQAVHVPIVMRFPKSIPADARVKQFVSIRDIPATILELAGIDDTELPGSSLSRFWNSKDASADTVYVSVRPVPDLPKWDRALRSVISDGMQLTEFGDGHAELHNLADDPRARVDLYSKPDSKGKIDKLKSQLDEHFGSN